MTGLKKAARQAMMSHGSPVKAEFLTWRYLQVHVGQLIFLDQVIYPAHLKPGLRLLLSFAKVNGDPKALFGVVQ